MPENAFYFNICIVILGLFIKVTLVLPDCVVFDWNIDLLFYWVPTQDLLSINKMLAVDRSN